MEPKRKKKKMEIFYRVIQQLNKNIVGLFLFSFCDAGGIYIFFKYVIYRNFFFHSK